jgi:hypothetical protein
VAGESCTRGAFDMRYEVRLANRVGPFARSTLGEIGLTSRSPGTRLTLTRREPLAIADLVEWLDLLGLELKSVRMRRVGGEP